jgi:hypothetical protein
MPAEARWSACERLANSFVRPKIGAAPETVCSPWARQIPNSADESVSPLSQRFDEARFLRVVFEGFADLADADFQNCLTDERGGPNGIQQFLFCDEPTGVVHQISQNSEGLWHQGDNIAVPVKALTFFVENEGRKVFHIASPNPSLQSTPE